MTLSVRSFPAGNPFSTRRWRPGALDYLFSAGESVATLIDRLRRQGWYGQVVGPHGTGKSTLLATLIPAIRDAGREPFLITLHDGRRRLTMSEWRSIPPGSAAIVIVDGYEQLSAWSRFRLRVRCRQRGLGLLVTSHEEVGLPELTQTYVSPELALAVVERLAPTTPDDRIIEPAEVVDRLAARSGNLREALFDLYDLYEKRRRRIAPSGARGESNGAERIL
jgi:hypothetical protein